LPDQALQQIQRTFVPTKQQLQFLQVFLSPDGPNTITKCANIACVARRTVYHWFQNEDFRQWFHAECSRQSATERELMWRNARRLAIAGSPEHIKLVAMKAGELIHAGSNDPQFRPNTAVFINVPRPELAPADVEQLPAGDLDQVTDAVDAASVVTPVVTAAENSSND